jgi:uncharacterized protein YhfF
MLDVLVLTRDHAVLLDETGRLPRVDTAAERALEVIEPEMQRRFGVTLPLPAGISTRGFAFVLHERPERGTFVPARLALPAHDDAWELYVETLLGGHRPPSRALDVFYFGDSPALAANLIHLVVCGRKRATACWPRAMTHEGIPLPTPGLISVATDWFGYPRAIIETVETQRVPFHAMTAELCSREGEGDLSLEDWRRGHLSYYGNEAARLGLTFDEREEILFETFRVLRVLGPAASASP